MKNLPEVYRPPETKLAVVTAWKALSAGTASEHQQTMAVEWLINEAADTYGFTYRTDPRDHAFAEGRRFVGQQVVKQINMTPPVVAALRSKDG